MRQENLRKLLDLLVDGEFASKEKIEELENESKATRTPIEDLLVQNEILSDEQLGQLVADVNNWHFVNLEKEAVDPDIMKLIPEKVARKQRIIAYKKSDKGVFVGMTNPDDSTIIHLLEKKLGAKIFPYYTTTQVLERQLKLYKSNISEEFEKIIKSNQRLKNTENDKTIIELVDELLSRGYEEGASDIHIEPFEENTLVRFRVDGLLKHISTFPKSYHDPLIARIKVMAHLRTDEHQTAQDGKLQYLMEGEQVDVRVSVVPTTKGENAVMRLLAEKNKQLTMEEIGLGDVDYKKLSKSIQNPWGMILVTGPTGSGKTTSLYSVLKILNRKTVNIATIEDPVEYNIDGITQIQVNPKAKLTFATGLKSIVRQDPDIIMVGEIRDSETADIAVNSAMTGHLVLSTLHTNDAPTAIPRLLDMGIEAFLVSSTVNIIIAQRLLRKICPSCIHSYDATPDSLKTKLPESLIQKVTGGKDTVRLYIGKGCPVCNNTGYMGRTGVFEILEVDDEIRKLIMSNANADMIREKAREKGMTTMIEDAVLKAKNGVTSVEELIRVVKE